MRTVDTTKEHTYKFYADAGHGWLAVKLSKLIELNLVGQITGYSYIRGKTAYLEEDFDMYQFVKAYEQKHGFTPMYTYKHTKGDRSPIRNYEGFSISNVNKAFSKE